MFDDGNDDANGKDGSAPVYVKISFCQFTFSKLFNYYLIRQRKEGGSEVLLRNILIWFSKGFSMRHYWIL